MNARLPLLVAALCGSLVLSHCAGNQNQYEITKSSAPKGELAAYTSYAWSSRSVLNLREENRNAGVVAGRIRNAVDSELQAKGWSKSTGPQTDLLASYSAVSQQAMESRKVDENLERADDSATGEADGGSPAVTTAEEGSLTVELRDRRTGKVVYRGTAEATLLDDPSPWKAETHIQQAVNRMLGDLPSRR